MCAVEEEIYFDNVPIVNERLFGSYVIVGANVSIEFAVAQVTDCCFTSVSQNARNVGCGKMNCKYKCMLKDSAPFGDS